FGVFEVDLEAGEVRKSGLRQKIAGQPFEVLRILLQHPQQVVTREDLRQRIWPKTRSSITIWPSRRPSTAYARSWVTPPKALVLSRPFRAAATGSSRRSSLWMAPAPLRCRPRH